MWPRALEGRKPPRPIAEAKLGVPGRPGVGEEALLPAVEVLLYIEPGRASREGERPGGRGELERGGCPVPTNFF